MKIATGAQIRAARNALAWSIDRLADESGVSARTIIRYEDKDGLPQTRAGVLERLVFSLENAGIEFIGTPDDAPGIRIHQR